MGEFSTRYPADGHKGAKTFARARKNFDRGRFRLDSPSSGGRVNSATKRLTGVAISAEPFNAQ